MNKLEVGMYVRTDLGNIGKIVEEYTHQNNKVSYPEPQEWVLDTGYILNEAMMCKNEEITKASNNIIDLIELGDYVNGEYVDLFSLEHYRKSPKNIKTIVTKEHFKSMEYRLGE